MKIRYKFATQETVEVEVGAELGAVIVEIERRDKNNDRRETRRHNSLEQAAERTDTEIADDSVDIEADYEAREEKRTLAAAIATLSDKQRRLVRLRYYENKTDAEIARELGVSRPAVTQQFGTIHKALKSFFDEF